jgi:hypothetical protein
MASKPSSTHTPACAAHIVAAEPFVVGASLAGCSSPMTTLRVPNFLCAWVRRHTPRQCWLLHVLPAPCGASRQTKKLQAALQQQQSQRGPNMTGSTGAAPGSRPATAMGGGAMGGRGMSPFGGQNTQLVRTGSASYGACGWCDMRGTQLQIESCPVPDCPETAAVMLT